MMDAASALEAQLAAIHDRISCLSCGHSFSQYCPRCHTPNPSLTALPRIRLPLHLLVLQHPRELPGKSTAVHAKLVAPESVEIRHWDPEHIESVPPLPELTSSDTVLLFPGPSAQRFDEMDAETLSRIRRVVVVDGTWRQARTMIRLTPELDALPRVTLNPVRKTKFWRFQFRDDETCLATIEAMYYLVTEYDAVTNTGREEGRDVFDPMMAFFRVQYERIQKEYRESGRTYTHRHRDGYIVREAVDGNRKSTENVS